MKPVLRINLAFVLAWLALFTIQFTAFAQATAFTYQGQLQNNGSPASGTYNLQFTLFATNTGGVAIAGPVTNGAVAVTNGLFTVTIDFGGGPWNGQSNWLQIAVETNSASATFTTLTPRQPITPVPYSIYAENGGTLASGAALGSGYGDSIANGTSNAFIGGGYENIIPGSGYDAFIGGGYLNTNNGIVATIGGGLYNLASGVGSFIGGGGYDGVNYLGNINLATCATIGGGLGNHIQSGANYSFIGGGAFNTNSGYIATVGGGYFNTAGNSYATVGGGVRNTASGAGAVVAGGGYDGTLQYGNTAGGNASVISGGIGNQASGEYSTISGGYVNTASGSYATVGGGGGNTAGGNSATVSGGTGNYASGIAATVAGYENSAANNGATVAGGGNNFASGFNSDIGGGANNQASQQGGVVSGGYNNTSSGIYASVPGGSNNIASGAYSFAAGQQAQATNQGAFVWADSQNAPFPSTANDQFLIRAQGGVGINTDNNPDNMQTAALYVQGSNSNGWPNSVVWFQNNASTINNAPALRVVNTGSNATNTDGALSVSVQGQGIIAEFGNSGSFVTTISNNGDVFATAFVGNGSALNNLNASLIGSGTVPLAQLPAAVVTNNEAAVTLTGTFSGNGGGLTSVNASTLGVSQLVAVNGAGLEMNTNFYLDNEPIFLRNDMNHGLAYNGFTFTNFGTGQFQIDGPVLWGFSGGVLGVLSGGAQAALSWNSSSVNVSNALNVGGNLVVGGSVAGNGSGLTNLNASRLASGMISYSVLPGFQSSSNYSVVGGGQGNVMSGTDNVIGGGYQNTNSGTTATVGGGGNNTASGNWATVGGGYDNTASGTYYATVSGGQANIASGYGSAIGGGSSNVVTQQGGVIAGGFNNTVSGNYAMVAGGSNNLASGDFSFAAGTHAQATNNGAFDWADASTNSAFGSASNNTFSVRASGGYRLYSNANLNSGEWLPAGSGTWASLSDRNSKDAFVPVNPQTVLASVAALPISRWSYKTEHGVRHLGPMAQDFHAAFNVGEDNRHIADLDESGVALAAIQGLNQKLDEKDKEIQQLQQSVAELKTLVAQLAQAKSK